MGLIGFVLRIRGIVVGTFEGHVFVGLTLGWRGLRGAITLSIGRWCFDGPDPAEIAKAADLRQDSAK